MTKQLFEWAVIDAFLTSDEWDHMRYLIKSEIEGIERLESFKDLEDLPFLLLFEKETMRKLIMAGFDKEHIENSEELRKMVEVLEEQGIEFPHHRFDLHPPYGLPASVYKIHPVKNLFQVEPHVEAALRAFENIQKLRQLLKNKGAVKVYLRSMELIVNLLRSGTIPSLAQAEREKKELSLQTRDLKQRITNKAIQNVFVKFPNLKKSLGAVWAKFDYVNKDYPFFDKRTKKTYKINTDKDLHGNEVVRITGDSLKKPLDYAKRSLQHLIDALK